MLIRLGAMALLGCGLALAVAPKCEMVPGWTQSGNPRSFVADNLFEYMDGNAEGYLLYGFINMNGVTCKKGAVNLVIDISEFGDTDSAFGMFTANRDLRQPSTKIGMDGQIQPRRAIFAKGVRYVEIAAEPEADHSALLKEWTAALEKIVDGSTEPPAALAFFPKENQESLRLVPESVLGLSMLKRGYVGQYKAGKAFIVMEESQATATALLQKLKARFSGATSVQIGEEGFEATDRYLGRLCVFRKGSYLGGYGNVPEGQDAQALAKAFAARLP